MVFTADELRAIVGNANTPDDVRAIVDNANVPEAVREAARKMPETEEDM